MRSGQSHPRIAVVVLPESVHTTTRAFHKERSNHPVYRWREIDIINVKTGQADFEVVLWRCCRRNTTPKQYIFSEYPYGHRGTRMDLVFLTLEASLSFITLLTDFGLRDGYSGVLKGVIWNILPDAQIADISHTISPQNVLEGALALSRTAFFFPDGTVHVAVVDPGVGTHRRPIAIQLGKHTFVGPDNGLFTLVIERAEREGWPIKAVTLDNPLYWLPDISRVFHGRDIFSPVAAHLASGVPLEQVGTPITDPVRIEIPRPRATGRGWSGQVITIDTFGNLATNLTHEELGGLGHLVVHAGPATIDGLVRTFGDRPAGELIALYGTHDDLIISVVNGNAAKKLGLKVGDAVDVVPQGK